MKSLRRSLNNSHGQNGQNGHGHGHGSGSSSGAPHHAYSNSQGNAMSMAAVTSPQGAGFPAGAAGVSDPTMPYTNPLARPSEKVAPPKKVIKALRNHRSTNPQELSYKQGDFWYVTGERDGWFEALNPLTGSRGLVPKDDFEEFVKGGRQVSAGAPPPQTPPSATQQQHARTPSQSASITLSQSGGQISPTAQMMVQPLSPQNAHHIPGLHGKKHQPLYAIVQYDFHAERPDELEARAGEPIVVIAQSNHEWFVAKPIGRLGGPGLIPVAFVEIRDPVTGKAVEVFPSTIPQVEEWKKATADYKAAAIPLGRLDIAPEQRVTNSPFAAQAQQNAHQQQQQQGGAAQQPVLAGQLQQQSRQAHQQHGSNPSHGSQRTAGTTRSGSPSSANAGGARQPSRAGSQATGPPVGYHPDVDNLLPPGELTQLAVPSFHNESGNYWFRLSAVFVPDERTAPAYTLILYRTYEDFYDFQITLLETFPVEAGRPNPGEEHLPPPQRILPYMPGPVDEEIDDELTEYRRDELDLYVRALLHLHTSPTAAYIMRHDLIRTFFAAKYGDYCEETNRNEAIEELEERMGDVSFESGPPSSSTSAAGIHHVGLGTRSGSEASMQPAPLPTGPVPPTRAQHNNNNNASASNWNYGPTPTPSSHTRTDSRGALGPMASDAYHANHASHANHTRNASSAGGSMATVGPLSNGPPQSQWSASPVTATGASFANHNPNMSAVTPMLPNVAMAPPAPTAPSPALPSAAPMVMPGAGAVPGGGPRQAPSHGQGAQSGSGGGSGGGSSAAAAAAFIKIKIHDRATDDLIALRVHPAVSYPELLDKVRARLGPAVSVLQYRVGGGGGGPCRQIHDDRGLAEWMAQEDKLVLYAEQ